MKKKLLVLVCAFAMMISPKFISAEGTLQSQIDKAEKGDVITLDKNYTEYIIVTKDITIDLDGYTLYDDNDDENINVVGATLTIRDSKGTGKIIQRQEYNSIELNTDYNIDKNDATAMTTSNKNEARAKVILESGTIESAGWGITLFNNSEFVMNGGKIVTTGDETYAICGNGTMDASNRNYGVNAKIVINDGEITSNDYAIYMPQAQGETVITGGTITGTAGAVAANRGKLTITGGTLISLGTDASPKDQTVKYNGPDWAYNAVIATPAVYTRNFGDDEDLVINISGNAKLVAKGDAKLIDSAIPNIAVNADAIKNAKDTTIITITSGTFSASVKTLLATGYVENKTDAEYVVKANVKLDVIDGKGNTVAGFESVKPMPEDYSLVVETKKIEDALNKTLTASAATKIEESYDKKAKVEDTSIIGVYDISVNNTDGVVEIKGTDLYTISLKVDESLTKGYKNFKVAYINDDKVEEILDASLVDGYIVFDTTHLSTYAIVGYNADTTVKNPNTLDEIFIYIGLALISLVGFVSAKFYLKKRYN